MLGFCACGDGGKQEFLLLLRGANNVWEEGFPAPARYLLFTFLRLSLWESSRQGRVRGVSAPFAYFCPLPSRRRLQTLAHLHIPLPSRRRLQTLARLHIPLPSRRRLQTLAHLHIPLRHGKPCHLSLKERLKRNAQTNNRRFFCLLFFSKRSVVKTKTEMKNHLCLLTIRFAQTNNRSFFCLLFFSKRSVVKTKTEMKKSPLFAYYKICTNQLLKLLLPSFLLEEKNGAYFSFQRKVGRHIM